MKNINSISVLVVIFFSQAASADLLCRASGKIQGINEIRIEERKDQVCISIDKGEKQCHPGQFSGSMDLFSQPVMTGVSRIVSIGGTGLIAPDQYQLVQSSVCSSYYYEERGCDDQRVTEMTDQLVCHQ